MFSAFKITLPQADTPGVLHSCSVVGHLELTVGSKAAGSYQYPALGADVHHLHTVFVGEKLNIGRCYGIEFLAAVVLGGCREHIDHFKTAVHHLLLDS